MTRTAGPAAVMALALAALAGCGEGGDGRSRLHLPGPGFVPDPGQGQALFRAHCAECHGADARGTAKGPPLVHPVYRPSHHADLAFHFAVRDGVRQHHWHFGDMPPVPGLTPEAVGHIVAWVRAEQRRAGIR